MLQRIINAVKPVLAPWMDRQLDIDCR